MSQKNSEELIPVAKRQGKKNKTPINITKETFSEWCDASSIHGIRYIGTGTRFDKTYWIIILLVSSGICVFQIQSSYQKWKDNPLTIGFDEKLVQVQDIPFPAITVCNNVLAVNNNVFVYHETYDKMSKYGTKSINQKFLHIFELISEHCVKSLTWSGRKRYELIDMFIDSTLNTTNVDELFKTLQQEPFLQRCSGLINNKWWECGKEFTPILTQNGICWTFNFLEKKELINDGVRYFYGDNDNKTMNWHPDKGFNSEDLVFPWRSKTFKTQLGLDLLYRRSQNLIEDCWSNHINIYVHHPLEVPYETKPWTLERALRKITITPEIMLASVDLQSSHTPEARKCYFHKERQLAFFKIYSQSNCQLECLANRTIKECGCSTYWMPGYETTPICRLRSYDCYILVKYKIKNSDSICKCLRLCNTITYNFERETLSTNHLELTKTYDMITSQSLYNEDEAENETYEDEVENETDEYDEEEAGNETDEYDEEEEGNKTDKYDEDETGNKTDDFNEKSKNKTDDLNEEETENEIDEYMAENEINGFDEEETENETEEYDEEEAENETNEYDEEEAENELDEYDEEETGNETDEFDQPEKEKNIYENTPTFLWIQFSKPEYLAMRMSAQFSLTDFISQCGGLLGLFMGVSILSVIELLYYFTVKLIQKIRN